MSSNILNLTGLLGSAALISLAAPAGAASLFSNFTPLPATVAAGSLPDDAPFQFGNPAWTQTVLASRTAQLAAGEFNSGNWDMHTLNETGTAAGRYLFAPFETAQAGVQRTDLDTGVTRTIWASPAQFAHVAFDASRWTPWGTYLTAEERWSDPDAIGSSPYGRLFEITNPLAAPEEINLVHRDILPRVSHEGLAFDKDGALYFIDERNGSHVFKYVSATPGTPSFFEKGQTFVLRVGDGTEERATGAADWVALTDADGQPLPGAVTGIDPNGLPFIDGRATPKLDDFRGTAYNRPEDMEIKTLADGRQVLFFATTTDAEVYALNLAETKVTRFADPSSIDAATGAAVGVDFRGADNIAIDGDGTVYIVEDQGDGKADIWATRDADDDGVADFVARWASLSTFGAEPTGLYFDPFRPGIAYVNVQHPADGNDRTILIDATTSIAPVPVPASVALLGSALAAFGGLRLRLRRPRRTA